MKTRNDFVSNSSSCSFVVAIPSEAQYKFKDFVKDVVKDCVANKNERSEMSKEELDKLNAFNARNLEYHLNSSELLFLGKLSVNDKTYTMKRPDPNDKEYANDEESYKYELELFECLQKDVKKKSFGKDTGEKLVEATDDSITVSYPVNVSGIAFPSQRIECFTGHYSFLDPTKETKKNRQYAAERIFKLIDFIKNPNDSNYLYYFINTSMYFISKNTIWNTRALLENKAKLIFEKWEDLDVLEKRLDEGQRLFVICQNQGGNGWDNDAIYVLGGWNAKFGEKATVEVIYAR